MDRRRGRSRSRSRDRHGRADRDRDDSRGRGKPYRGDTRDRSNDRRSKSPDRRRDYRDRSNDRADGRSRDLGRDRDRGTFSRPLVETDKPLPTPPNSTQPTSTNTIDNNNSKLSARQQEELSRQERLEMVKRLTAGNDYDEKRGKNEDDEDYDIEEDMMEIMGFKGFDTTKGKTVEENLHSAAAGAAAKHKKRVYRQYMNRKGGFNRPLQKIA